MHHNLQPQKANASAIQIGTLFLRSRHTVVVMSRLETEEKELELCMGSTIEQIGRSYKRKDVGEEEELIGKLSDIKLRVSIAALARIIIRLRKVSERYRDDGLQLVGYDVLVHIDCDQIDYKIVHRTNDIKE